MFPGIGTLINGLGVLIVGILARLFFKKDIKNFEENLLPLGLLVLALGVRESLKSPDFILFSHTMGTVAAPPSPIGSWSIMNGCGCDRQV